MIDRIRIRNLAGMGAYSRGNDLFYAKKVYDFKVEAGSRYDNIAAVVQGSGANQYQVSLLVDRKEDQVDVHHCQCPELSEETGGLCRHCVAALLAYDDYRIRKDAQRRERNRSKESLAAMDKAGSDASGQMLRQTAPEIKRIIRRAKIERALPVIQEELYGKVRLEPTLRCGEDGIGLTFRIGAAQMYVLRDVSALLRAIRNQEDVRYGVRLSFVHSPEMFDETSRDYLRFLADWVYEQEAGGFQEAACGHAKEAGGVREISLTTGALERFLDTAGEHSFDGSVPGEETHSWHVTDKPYKKTLRIAETDGGILLSLGKSYYCRTPRHYMFFEDGRIYPVAYEKAEPIRDFLSLAARSGDGGIFIGTGDVPAFSRELLPDLAAFYEVVQDGFDPKRYGLLPVTFDIYLDTPSRGTITCKLLACYGEQSFYVYNDTREIGRRDVTREAAAGRVVSDYFNAYDGQRRLLVLTGDDELLGRLLEDGIARLKSLGTLYISQNLKQVRITHAPHLAAGLSLSGQLLRLSLSSDDMSEAELLELLTKYDRKKKYYRLKKGDFVCADEELHALMRLTDELHLSRRELLAGRAVLPGYRALYVNDTLAERGIPAVHKDRAFADLIERMRTASKTDTYVPPSLLPILRPYQKQGYFWLNNLAGCGFGGILADDMGLGKTLQVITFLESEHHRAKAPSALIVAPASLVFNWSSELARFAPDLPVVTVTGTQQQREACIKTAGPGTILVTSYDLLKRDIECYKDIRFGTQVIDEAQYIKNHQTKAARAVKKIQASFKLALTGTPVENALSELWSIFDYIMPGFLYSYATFREELEGPITQNGDEAARSAATKRLRKMIRPFILRRMKKDVLFDLPDKLEENYYADMQGEQLGLYHAHLAKLRRALMEKSEDEVARQRIQILAELTRLRQLCCDPALLYENYHEASAKTALCLELVTNAVRAGHKILLFSQFTSMLAILGRLFEQEGISYCTLTGQTKKEERARMVKSFATDDISVFNISLKAGGTGLNLTAADIVIHFDPWWNEAVQNQATDRAHRIGQKHAVTVCKLITKGTIEEKIRLMQAKKKELARRILDGEGFARASFTKEELLELLG